MKNARRTYLLFLLSFIIILIPLCSSALDLTKLKGTVDDEVIRLLEALPPDESYTDASVVVILDEKVDEVRPNRTYRSTMHAVFKVIKEGGKGYANVEIGYNARHESISIEYARTFTPQGDLIPLSREDVNMVSPYSSSPSYSDYKVLSFSLPGVMVGSIIEYKVVIDGRRPTIEGEYASSFYFQGNEPTFTSRFKVIAAEDMELRYTIENAGKDIPRNPTIYYDNAKKVMAWEYKNIPQIIPEFDMPPLANIALNIRVTTVNSWDDFVSWWNRCTASKTEPNNAIRKKVAELTKGLKDPMQKAATLFYYVEREIRDVYIDLEKTGYEPTSAPKVFENKYGNSKDKSTLLISMLKAAKIPAYYVLIPNRWVGRLNKEFPYPFQFNHCIVAIDKKKGYHFLDTSAETYSFNYLPSDDQDRDALLIKNKRGIFVHTPLARPQDNGILTQQTIRIRVDGSVEVDSRTVTFGDAEASSRATHTDYTPSALREVCERTISALHPGARLVDCEISDPLDFEKPFSRRYRYILENYCKRAGNLLIFRMPDVSYACITPVTDRRRYPIELPSVHSLRNEAEVSIPEGYQVHYLPKPVEIETPYFDFRSSYRCEEGKIIYRGEKVRKATLVPLHDYPLYRKFCQEMEKDDKEWLVFKKKDGL